MSKILKSDGLRGIAVTELSCEILLYLGRAAAQVIGRMCGCLPVFYIARDTRRSAPLLEAALCAGICSGGGNVIQLGVLPSAAVALMLAKEENKAHCGMVLTGGSASYEYMNLRMLNRDGSPLAEDTMAKIESLMPGGMPMPPKSHRFCGQMFQETDGVQRYRDLLKTLMPVPKNMTYPRPRIAVDCANGSLSAIAEPVLREYGMDVIAIQNQPDGTNINRDCGVTAMQNLMEFVKKNGCQAGFAFDGDGTRCIAVDENGELLDGDRLLAICLQDAIARDALRGGGVAATVLSNLGFLRFAKENGITVHTTQPSPHFVLERVREAGLSLGGERGGHLYFAEFPSSDGLVSALRILEIMQRTKQPLSVLSAVMEHDPQVSLNVKIAECWREIWKNDTEITDVIEKYEAELGTEGRILVRELARDAAIQVLLEGRDFRQINSFALEIAEKIRQRTAYVPA